MYSFPASKSTVVEDATTSPNTWAIIPSGDAHEPAFEDADYVKHLPVAMQQHSLPYCTVYSLLSAFTLYGDMTAVAKLLPEVETIINSPRGDHPHTALARTHHVQ